MFQALTSEGTVSYKIQGEKSKKENFATGSPTGIYGIFLCFVNRHFKSATVYYILSHHSLIC